MSTLFKLRVNGTTHSIRALPDTPLLYVLRNDLKLNGPKFGCGQAHCGACSVLIDGIEQRSCMTPVRAASSGSITTIEGLGSTQRPSELQRAFVLDVVLPEHQPIIRIRSAGLVKILAETDGSQITKPDRRDERLARCA